MKKNVKLIVYLIIFGCIVSLGYVKVLKNDNYVRIDNQFIGAYLDGEYIENIPLKGSVLFDHAECDNGATATWDNDAWGLLTTNMSKRTKCNVYFKKTVADQIIASVDTTGKCPTVNADGSVTVLGLEAENGYVCSAPDAYGTSYYFRGNVTNNYVYFAGYYWRIVRINGDGTIRIIYDGTVAYANNDESADKLAGVSEFSYDTYDNAYVGYMYGKVNATTYEDTHRNTNSSTIKQFVDKWHEDHIKTNYSSYLADNVFCNDRSFSPKNTGTGADYSETAYRWYYDPLNDEVYTGNMLLTCPQKNDAFTTEDTIYGNGALTYPVGLISLDEVVLAGGWYTENTNYYLYSSAVFWTLSPYAYDSYSSVGVLRAGLTYFPSNITVERGVRPVYNLKAGSLISGDGTSLNPYKVTES